MQIVVRADDGDQITVNADDLATEQMIIRLDLVNLTYGESCDFESVALTVERARELAAALLTVANSIGDVETGGSSPLSPSQTWSADLRPS